MPAQSPGVIDAVVISMHAPLRAKVSFGHTAGSSYTNSQVPVDKSGRDWPILGSSTSQITLSTAAAVAELRHFLNSLE